jgi:hypothetical protein
MGFEILALTFIKTRAEALTSKTMEESIKYSTEQHSGIFASTGEGLGMTAVIISFHKNYTDYHKQLNRLRIDWKELIENIQTFVVSIGEGEFKRFSLTYLKDVPLELGS